MYDLFRVGGNSKSDLGHSEYSVDNIEFQSTVPYLGCANMMHNRASHGIHIYYYGRSYDRLYMEKSNDH